MGEQPTFAKQIVFCRLVFLLQLHFLKLSNSQFDDFYETSYKFEQGNGAIAACWQAKAGVEPPFAGCRKSVSLRMHFVEVFRCLRLVIENNALRNTTRIRFGKAGAHPQLAFGIAIAPETISLITTF